MMSTSKLPEIKRLQMVLVLLIFLLLAFSACQKRDPLKTVGTEEVESEKTIENPGSTIVQKDEPTEEPTVAPIAANR